MFQYKNLESEFASVFSHQAEGKVYAPGRVNLIGEHTDYNGGFVLPCALDIGTTTVFRAREDSQVRVRSLQYPEYVDRFDLSTEIDHCDESWANYIRGVFHVIRSYGFKLRRGVDLMISSQLPQDGGLASSAALATSVGGAVTKALKLPLDKRSLALIAQKAENDFLGKQCGVMDQLTASMAREGHLLLLDCEDFATEHIPLPPELSIVIIDSCSRQTLIGDEYNDRRKECERAARIMNVKSLRHASMKMLEAHQGQMDEMAFRRARHVISENERTRQVAEALKHSDTSPAYRLMFESHLSMKNDFEITTPQLDALVEYCREALGHHVGARMTGGGFGGSIVALCEKPYVKKLVNIVTQKYQERYRINTQAHICRPECGMRVAWIKPRRQAVQAV